MRIRIVVASLATALTGALAIPAAATAAPAEPDRIIGGNTVSSAPWAAAVFSNGSFTCSGTIISANFVSDFGNARWPDRVLVLLAP